MSRIGALLHYPGIYLGAILLLFSACATTTSDDNATKPHARLSPQVATDIALNSFSDTASGVVLNNPNHEVLFSNDRVFFEPRKGPHWEWRLDRIDGLEVPLTTAPQRHTARTVRYFRGPVIEEYEAKATVVEQRFILESRPFKEPRDLQIEGTVKSASAFRIGAHGEGIWTSPSGEVTFGKLFAHDAHGQEIPSNLKVSADRIVITVDGAALASATFPVVIDPELGSNDQRLSDMGTDGSTAYTPSMHGVAYNSTNNEYLVVWQSDDNSGSLVDDEFEIYGQRIDAATGAEVGTNDFRISSMGPDGDSSYDAFLPSVAYNSTSNEYLVVWAGDDNTAPLVEGEGEIFGQRIAGATGAEVGTDDFRISDLGTDGNISEDAGQPALVYNPARNEYLVVFIGDDDTAPLVPDELEVFGQLLNADGTETGPNDFRISDMGPNADLGYQVDHPSVAFNSVNNEYLVVWNGTDNSVGTVAAELEIWGQRINAADGTEIGTNDFRISDVGADGDIDSDAYTPSIAYNPNANEYLVVWGADDPTGTAVNDEFEVYGQRLSGATGAEVGTNDFRISDMGPDGSTLYGTSDISVAYNSLMDEYFVAWSGDDNTSPLVEGEFEVFGQRLTGTGVEVGENDFRLSDLGPDGSADFDATALSAVWNSTNNQIFIAFSGDDNASPLVDNEPEIFGQRYIAAEANLSVGVVDTPDSVTAGESLAYSVSVSNASTGTAYGINVVIDLPTGVTYQSGAGTGWSCSSASQVVTCLRDSLAGSSDAPTLTVTASVALSVIGAVSATTTVATTKSLDSVSANDSATTETTVLPPPPDLTTELQRASRRDNTVKGRVVCNNAGPGDASSFTVKVYLSRNATLETERDRVLKSVEVSSLTANAASSPLRFRKSMRRSPARKYVIAICDSENSQSEVDETNNSDYERLS